MGISVRSENRFDRLIEQPSDGKRQGKTGVVLTGFDGIDRLSGDGESRGQVGLRPRSLGPKHPQPVVHRYLRRTINWPTLQLTNRTSQSHCQESAMGVFGTTSNLAKRP